MTEENELHKQLTARVDDITRKQYALSVEISSLRKQVEELKKEPSVPKISIPEPPVVITAVPEKVVDHERTVTLETIHQNPNIKEPSLQSGLEKFIGENLINKIGIAVTIIGVAIGTKYSIEHQLISPLTRIILGYLLGIALIAVGLRLKRNYENYSAVLVSGAMAILYFITYSAYGFYNLFPQVVAFALMLVFTVFTVIAALNYNRQVIAHIGLVGAYAVPFLLSENSGKIEILFAYTAIINCGILTIAVKKYWKPLYYSSFFITWLVFNVWYTTQYSPLKYFALALTFLGIFFAIFYAIFLVYKLNRKEKFDIGDIFLLLSNSFIFYAVGYSALDSHKGAADLLGLFTLFNALIHFVVSLVIYRHKLADRNLFYLVAGLVLVFITIAIPVQLNGHWVTLLWTFEAALLFWIGRTRNAGAYEKLSFVLMALAFISIVQDWIVTYSGYPSIGEKPIVPILNISFLTGILFVACFGFIQYIAFRKKSTLRATPVDIIADPRFFIPAFGLIVLYFSIRFEIFVFFKNRIIAAERGSMLAHDLRLFKNIWIINYSLFFVSIITMINNKVIKNKYLSVICFALGSIALLVFLTQGLYGLSELRDNFFSPNSEEPYIPSGYNIGIRYIAYLFAGFMLYSLMGCSLQPVFDYVFMVSLLWIASSELISMLDIFSYHEIYKLMLSILWGIYAFVLTGWGIWKKKKHLRISALVLFSMTLIKLFFYDMSNVGTLARTAGFLSLGLLLLFVSFLYNKYKYLIS